VAHLRLTAVTVHHPGAIEPALRTIDLEVADGARTVLVGASGSGKTTLLRTVAGVAPVTAGRVELDGRDVTALPPRDRDTALVSQEGALQPHLDVRRNLGFALRLRRVPRAEEDVRVAAEARAFSLRGLLGRRPASLAAGERHEVALARTLVRPCAVLLLDEPFARIDAARRGRLRRELARVQEGYAVTMLVTTNDPVTALALAHQVVVLESGRVLQAGAPHEVAARPGSVAVAELFVVPAMNLVAAVRHGSGPDRHLVAGGLRVPAPHLPAGTARRVTLGVRPHDLVLADRGVPVPVRRRSFLGAEVDLTVGRASDPPLTVRMPRPAPDVGATVRLTARPGRVHLFDAIDGHALVHGV
jgi:ABC-type sugar transport system ATPase subunit